MKFKYSWLHTRTLTEDTREIECRNRLEFLENLNMWNRFGGGIWIYWEYHENDLPVKDRQRYINAEIKGT